MYAQALSAESQAKLASQDAPPFGQTENGEPFFAWFSLPSKNMWTISIIAWALSQFWIRVISYLNYWKKSTKWK